MTLYDHRRSMCGDKGDAFSNQFELGHSQPPRAGGDNAQELVLLCSNSHARKSYLECLTPFQDNPLANVFEPSVYDSLLRPVPKLRKLSNSCIRPRPTT